MNREEYLNAACALLRPMFAAAGFPLPSAIRMTCGFPSKGALAKKSRRIGECWSSICSADQHFEILVSPLEAHTVAVLGILVHELTHAAVGLECGHKGAFAKCARAMLLEGKLTATTTGEAFRAAIAAPIIAALGDYPHATLSASNASKKQSTRLLKCECSACGYVARVTAKWIDSAGAPVCPMDRQQMECV